ncbi:MAG TPA: type I-E CRISPR-associated protein Cas7/Cse4/CasC, partial [Ilumatobacteraceae bacterium]|nr:type I-E CRISPR-associated protein Cas7/Cse4/CasC [Ilumatobacteraceae bacterium]
MTIRYIDVHVLQTVPPSNINRDDTGSPKQARYGGVDRARVSSQAWKRATRTHFWAGVDPSEQSTRTKRVVTTVADRLVARTGVDRDAASRMAIALTADLNITPDKKEKKKGAADAPADPEASYLLFFGLEQIDSLIDQVEDRVAALAELDDDALKKELSHVSAAEHLSKGHPIDVALFGRMVADLTSLNVDAAAQVAHAISTHAVQNEF